MFFGIRKIHDTVGLLNWDPCSLHSRSKISLTEYVFLNSILTSQDKRRQDREVMSKMEEELRIATERRNQEARAATVQLPSRYIMH